MTESFEDVIAEMRKVITDDCDQTYCAMYDDDCYACEGAVLDRMQKAHDHEFEHLRRLRFREGYEAGQRSMDAAHYLLKLRLQGLKFGDGSHENLSRLAYAIYPCPTGWGKESCEGLRDKLIELLGGVHDEPEPIPASGGACDADCDCRNGDKAAVRITDELRKFKGHINAGLTPEMVLALRAEVNCIADRIDEQFNRICWQQEAVLQQTIDTMVEERDKLVDNRDMWRGKAMQLTDVVDRYVGRYEDVLELLRDAVVDFKNANYSWNYALIVGENITIETERNRLAKERDELRKSLREIAERVGVPHDIDLDEYSDDLVAKTTLGAIDSTHEYIGALEWQRDRQRKLLDEYDKTHMKLPVDANGESVHVGDIMEYAEGGKPKEVIAVSNTEAFLVDDGPRYSSLCVHHAPVDTAENIVRDIHLGKVTDSQAIERIRALNG